jgi:hypothetical protein
MIHNVANFTIYSNRYLLTNSLKHKIWHNTAAFQPYMPTVPAPPSLNTLISFKKQLKMTVQLVLSIYTTIGPRRTIPLILAPFY